MPWARSTAARRWYGTCDRTARSTASRTHPGGRATVRPPLLDEWALTGWIELFGLSPLPSQAGSGLQRWGGPIEEGYRVEIVTIVDRELFRRFSGGL